MKVIRRGGGVEGENLIYKFAAIFVAKKSNMKQMNKS